MSDDFGTVNVRAGAGTREIEILRKHYRDHRSMLAKLASEAPSEHLATEYGRLVRDVDASLQKLDEIERGAAQPQPQPAAPQQRQAPMRSAVREAAWSAPAEPHGDPMRDEGAPMSRPLVTNEYETGDYQAKQPTTVSSGRFTVIVIGAIAVVAIIGWLVWRASSAKKTSTTITEQPVATETAAPVTAAPTPAPQPKIVPATIVLAPPLADFGAVRKGTRAVRQIEVSNTSGAPLQYQVARSQCRCLYYEYKGKLDPKQHETLTVTIDGAKAKSGALEESIAISSKADPNVTATFQVKATVR